MLGLTPLGILHTALSLVAVASGFSAVFREREIALRSRIGRLYVLTTVLTCLTGFGIFQHGGFGKPHALGVLTLLVLVLAWAAERGKAFGRAAPYVATVSYSTTLFFHMIPGFTESLTRLPPSAPLVPNDQAPALLGSIGVTFVVFLIGVSLQVRRLRAKERAHAR